MDIEKTTNIILQRVADALSDISMEDPSLEGLEGKDLLFAYNQLLIKTIQKWSKPIDTEQEHTPKEPPVLAYANPEEKKMFYSLLYEQKTIEQLGGLQFKVCRICGAPSEIHAGWCVYHKVFYMHDFAEAIKVIHNELDNLQRGNRPR